MLVDAVQRHLNYSTAFPARQSKISTHGASISMVGLSVGVSTPQGQLLCQLCHCLAGAIGERDDSDYFFLLVSIAPIGNGTGSPCAGGLLSHRPTCAIEGTESGRSSWSIRYVDWTISAYAVVPLLHLPRAAWMLSDSGARTTMAIPRSFHPAVLHNPCP